MINEYQACAADRYVTKRFQSEPNQALLRRVDVRDAPPDPRSRFENTIGRLAGTGSQSRS